MEKIIEKDTMDNVFKVIDKHFNEFDKLMKRTSLKRMLAELNGDDDKVKECDLDMHDFASAMAALTMVKRELKGEVEY